MSLSMLIKLFEDEPGFIAHLPRRAKEDCDFDTAPGVPHHNNRRLIVAAFDAVRLEHLARLVDAKVVAEELRRVAEKLYRETGCEGVAACDLVRLIQGHWPPPGPSQGVRLIEGLAAMSRVYAELGDTKTIEVIVRQIKLICEQAITPPPPHGIVRNPLPPPPPHTGGGS